jgi:hypothetical protein
VLLSLFSGLFVDDSGGNNIETGLYCTEVGRFES